MDDGGSVFFGVAGLLVNAAGLAFIAIQVSLARRQFAGAQKAEVEELSRRRKEATINAFNATLEIRRSLHEVLPDDWDQQATRAVVERIIAGDALLERTLRNYLGYLENFSVSVSGGVYDLEVADALFGPRLIRIVENYKPYIDARRQEVGHEGVYAELEWLAAELTSRSLSGPPYVPLAHRPVPPPATP